MGRFGFGSSAFCLFWVVFVLFCFELLLVGNGKCGGTALRFTMLSDFDAWIDMFGISVMDYHQIMISETMSYHSSEFELISALGFGAFWNFVHDQN